MSGARPAGPTSRDLVVVGASAGGVDALRSFLGALPADLPAAVLVVLHIPQTAGNALTGILSRAGALPAAFCSEQEPLRPGRVVVAPPNLHLTVRDDHLHLSHGPRENGHRPAVDVLFRSAARAAGSRVIAVVLSGTQDDGTAGAVAVQQGGGLVIVQDPSDAAYPSMPQSVLDQLTPDVIGPAPELGKLVADLVRTPAAGTGSPEPTKLLEQNQALEIALWTALRALEERAALSNRLADRAANRGSRISRQRFLEQASEATASADVVRQLLETSPSPVRTAL